MKLQMDSLCEYVQASPLEIQDALESRKAVLIQDSWRVLDRPYLASLLTLVLLSCQELDISCEQIVFSSMAASLVDHDIPETILFHILKIFSDSVSGNTTDKSLSDYIFTLSLDQVSRFVGEQLLIYENMNGVSLDQFLDKWTATVPEGFPVSMDLLQVCYSCSNQNRALHFWMGQALSQLSGISPNRF